MRNVETYWIIAIHKLENDLSKIFSINKWKLNFLNITFTISFVVGWILLGHWFEHDFMTSHGNFNLITFLAWKRNCLPDLSDAFELPILFIRLS
jgi:hypothetical protein